MAKELIQNGSANIKVEGHLGAWYAIDTTEMQGVEYFLLEHEEYGDEAACVIVNKNGELVLEDVWNGFQDLEEIDEQLTDSMDDRFIFSPTKEPEKMVGTNMGSIPVEDYREIVARQSGFDSYVELYNEGYRLGDGYDKEPALHRAKRLIHGIDPVEIDEQLTDIVREQTQVIEASYEDAFFVHPDTEEVLWMYYNPDSAAGGQYVTNKLTFDTIVEAAELKGSVADFFEYLEENSRQELTDIGTEFFESAKEQFKQIPILTECTPETMYALKDVVVNVKEFTNTALYNKAFAEQEEYRQILGCKSADEVLKHTYEYATREDILLSLEQNDLSIHEARALLQAETPVADIFSRVERTETDYMEQLIYTAERQAQSYKMGEPMSPEEYAKLEQTAAAVYQAEAQPRLSDKPRIFVDMDGTLAQFKQVEHLETLYEEGYFRNLAPLPDVVAGVNELIADPDVEVYTLSAVLADSKTALQEKREWLAEHLPDLDAEHQIFVPCGANKSAYIPRGIKETDILLDDYTKNLLDWERAGGNGIKLVNDINNQSGRWMSDKVNYIDPILSARILSKVLAVQQEPALFNIYERNAQKDFSAEKSFSLSAPVTVFSEISEMEEPCQNFRDYASRMHQANQRDISLPTETADYATELVNSGEYSAAEVYRHLKKGYGVDDLGHEYRTFLDIDQAKEKLATLKEQKEQEKTTEASHSKDDDFTY